MRKLRGLRDRDKVPGPIHKGVAMCLERGNNLGIPKTTSSSSARNWVRNWPPDSCPGFVTRSMSTAPGCWSPSTPRSPTPSRTT